MATMSEVSMTGEQMVALTKRHTLFEWSAQAHVDPIPVARAKGVHFWTPEGKRYIDFNSQLMCVNAGHGDPRIVKAIQDQAATLAYANPFMDKCRDQRRPVDCLQGPVPDLERYAAWP